MRQCMDAENLHRRLKKIIGQVQAIDRMVDEDVTCEDILSQINAAKSALHRVGQVVLEGHIKHCVRDGIEHGDADKTIENFTKAVPPEVPPPPLVSLVQSFQTCASSREDFAHLTLALLDLLSGVRYRP